jgi:hypothetical protein
MMTGGLHLSLGRRESAYRFGFNPGWAEAEMFAGPDLFPEALFYFFFFFSSFSVFYFLCNFCKNASNQFKPLS